MSPSSLSTIPTCYATVSVGTPAHHLADKLAAIAAADFQGIELGFPDLLSWARRHHGREIDDHDWAALSDAAAEARKMCETKKLKVVMLQPFANFEGWAEGSKERGDAFERARGWVRIMRALGCDMLQVGHWTFPFRDWVSCF